MYCRKCHVEAADDAKICRSCGSILDEGPEYVAESSDIAVEQSFSMSWLEPPPEPIEAMAMNVVESQSSAPADEVPMGADWLCEECGSTVPWNFEVCWKCVTSDPKTEREAEQQSELQAFLDQVEAEQPPPEPELEAQLVNEPIDAAPVEVVRDLIQTPCRFCGSSRIMTNVPIQDHHEPNSGTLKVLIFNDPNAMFFKGAHRSEITADICGDCGHMELRVTNPRQLYRHWKSAF